MSATADVVEWEALGSAIRERRLARGMTLVELAADVELSQPFLSQVENGRARPSMASLYRIAHALDTTPQAFFGGPVGDAPGPVVVRSGDVRTVPVGDAGGDAAAVCRLLLTGDVPFHVLELVDLPPAHLGYWEHDGFEAVVVTAGEVELDVGGDLTILRAGDVASYSARLPHRLRSVGRGSSRVLLIETRVEAVQGPSTSVHAPARPRPRRRRPRA